MQILQGPLYTDPRFPFRFDCPKYDCYYGASFESEEMRAYWIEHHPCQKTKRNYVMDETDEKGMPYTIPTHGKSIAEKIWDMLDVSLRQLYAEQPNNDAWNKARCGALADVLVIFASPYYPDAASVTREAVKRNKIQKGEIPWEPTPGYRYNPPIPGSEPYKRAMAKQLPPRETKTSTAAKKAAAVTLSPAVVQSIQMGFTMGMSAEELSQAYSVPISVVQEFAKN